MKSVAEIMHNDTLKIKFEALRENLPESDELRKHRKKRPFGCSNCDGYGNLTTEAGATRCQCKENYFRKLRLRRANIPRPYLVDYRLESFLGAGSKARANMYAFAKRYADNFDATLKEQRRTGLVLWGRPGTGKTHLAVGILINLIEQGYSGYFVNWKNLLDRVRRTYDRDASESVAFLDDIKDADVLVIDDLGSTRSSEWAASMCLDLIDHRYRNRKPLIITTMVNWEFEFDPLIDPTGATKSRLTEITKQIPFDTLDDYRPLAGKGKAC